jgi:cyanobactin maturation PatA/PatG family protease
MSLAPMIESLLDGLEDLWRATRGDSEDVIAVLDGPVDASHPSLVGASLRVLASSFQPGKPPGEATIHGTHVASVIFGQHAGPVRGIAPGCSGLIVPVYGDGGTGSFAVCSQRELAVAIEQALEAGACVINVSGGQFSPAGHAERPLAQAVRRCAERDVLVVAAAGNEGCECLHVPGALPSVLAVGAADRHGQPLSASNWGSAYQIQGVLAPGEEILGAGPNRGLAAQSGTSFATAIVSGLAALLLSLARRLGRKPSGKAVRKAILQSARRGPAHSHSRRWLAGHIHIPGAVSLITQGGKLMSPPIDLLAAGDGAAAHAGAAGSAIASPATREGHSTATSAAHFGPGELEASSNLPGEQASGCGCPACSCKGGGAAQLVYALGELGYDFGTEARRDSIKQHMSMLLHPTETGKLWVDANPHDPVQLLDYLDKNPWDAASLIWTLTDETTPVYAIAAGGPFAHACCERLRQYLREQLQEGVERVSIPGLIAGQARLQSGQVVPVVRPELRGMYNWKISSLVEANMGTEPPESAAAADHDAYHHRARGLRNFLERVYYELRNRGQAAPERAINFAATQTFEVGRLFTALDPAMELDTIEAERSPLCRPDADCWDVKISFFNPESQALSVRKIYRMTVDVSDVVPVTLGRTREWFVR